VSAAPQLPEQRQQWQQQFRRARGAKRVRSHLDS
jgi:hypothetical protein